MEELEILGQKDPGLREALRSLSAIKMDKATRETYLRRQMAIMDHKSQALAYREEGRNLEKIELAKNALAAGFSLDSIALITKLPLEEIKKLQEEN